MNDPQPSPTNQCALWHLPRGSLLRATEERADALHLVTILLAEGMPPAHLRLDCSCGPGRAGARRPDRHHAPRLKWR